MVSSLAQLYSPGQRTSGAHLISDCRAPTITSERLPYDAAKVF